MVYLIINLDLTEPFEQITVPEQYAGVAVVIRDNGSPAGFFMKPLLARKTITRDELQVLCRQHAETPPPRPVAPAVPRPSVTLAICTRNRPELMHRCLSSIRELVPEPGCRPEVIVVDNAPSDERTRIEVERFSEVRYVREFVPGLDFARNRALRESTSDLVAFLDDDATVDRGWLTALMDAWRIEPNAGAFAGPVLPLELATRAQVVLEYRGGFGRMFRRVIWGPTQPGSPGYPCGGIWFGAGCNMVVRRDAAIEVGMFDEALDTSPPYVPGGDIDMWYRIIRAGYVIVHEPGLLVFHQHRRTQKELRRQLGTWGEGLGVMTSKYWNREPELRMKWLIFLAGCIGRSARDMISCFVRRDPRLITPDLAFTEIAGILRGLRGMYPDSVERSRALAAGSDGL